VIGPGQTGRDTRLGLPDELDGKATRKLAQKLGVVAIIDGKVGKAGRKRSLHLEVHRRGKPVDGFTVEFKSATSSGFRRGIHDEIGQKLDGAGDDPAEDDEPKRPFADDGARARKADEDRKRDDDERARKADEDRRRADDEHTRGGSTRETRTRSNSTAAQGAADEDARASWARITTMRRKPRRKPQATRRARRRRRPHRAQAPIAARTTPRHCPPAGAGLPGRAQRQPSGPGTSPRPRSRRCSPPRALVAWRRGLPVALASRRLPALGLAAVMRTFGSGSRCRTGLVSAPIDRRTSASVR
jgi:hypothetical protein